MIKVRKTNERYTQSLMIEYDFDKLVAALSASSPSIDVIYQLTSLIKQQSIKSLSSFISQSFQSLLILEQWTWQLFSKDSLRWINEPHYIDLFHTLASFNKTLIYTSDNIENDCKVSLLFPETIDQLNCVFKHIEQIDDENHPYISIINLWFNNHSYFLHDNLQYIALPIIDHIGEYFVRNYMMNRQFKVYLSQLQQPQISQSKISAKMLFYIKTCSFYLYVYLGAKCYNFFYTPEEMIRYLADDYLQIILVHHHTVGSWNTEFLSCMAHLIALTCRCCWWGGESAKMISQTKILLPTEQITYEYIRNLMRIVAHTPLYQKIKTHRSNDETVLLEASLLFIIDTIQTNNINWLFRSKTSYQKILLTVAELSINDVICIAVYHIMGIVLTDEQMKELKMNDGAAEFSFNMLEKAWSHPSKLYKQIPIMDILEGQCLTKVIRSSQQFICDLSRYSKFLEE